jgi:hypothetical protein
MTNDRSNAETQPENTPENIPENTPENIPENTTNYPGNNPSSNSANHSVTVAATNTITFQTSTRNRLLAKLIVLLLVTGGFSQLFLKVSQQDYQKGLTLTPEAYSQSYERYRAQLLSKKMVVDYPAVGVFAVFLVLLGLVGGYELAVFVIGLLIGKLWPSGGRR